ncbi:hypothetical protein [Streptomyces sp. NPDC007991]|uniref:hypothetical protein n=1 Tax=Streptomyces sp. NPDC007991 TaxID=3364803 RepID=UPI0036F17923
MHTLLAAATSKPVGDGRMPQAEPPYYIQYVVDASVSGAPLADDNEDMTLIVQITSVSGPDPSRPGSAGTLDQALWMADKARRAFLARDPVTGLWVNALNLPGVKNTSRSVEIEPGGTSDPNDAIINDVQRFRFDLTPA